MQKLAKDVEENGVFCIICDECTDIANQEQLSLSVRYVVREKVCESFIGFFELDEGVSGEAIGGKIEKAIADWYLDPLDQGGRLMMEQAICRDSIKVVQLHILQKITQSCLFSLLLSCFKFGYCEFL